MGPWKSVLDENFTFLLFQIIKQIGRFFFSSEYLQNKSSFNAKFTFHLFYIFLVWNDSKLEKADIVSTQMYRIFLFTRINLCSLTNSNLGTSVFFSKKKDKKNTAIFFIFSRKLRSTNASFLDELI